MLDWAGIGNPYLKIYITSNTTQYISLIAFLFTIFQFPKLQYSEKLGKRVVKLIVNKNHYDKINDSNFLLLLKRS